MCTAAGRKEREKINFIAPKVSLKLAKHEFSWDQIISVSICGQTCLGGNISDESESLVAGVVHVDHLLSSESGLLTLFHHLRLISCCIDHGQQVLRDVLLQLWTGWSDS